MKNNSSNFFSIENIMTLVVILFTAQSFVLFFDDTFFTGVFFIVLFLFILLKKKLDIQVIYLFVYWLAINVAAFFVNKTEFSFITLTGLTIKYFIPYFFLKLIGPSFWNRFIKYAVLFSIISLPVFVIQLIFPQIFFSLSNYLNFMSQTGQFDNQGWYLYVYMFSAWAFDRNCGFMWEPGAFAFVLIIIIVFKLYLSDFKTDRTILILVLALITTFSTMGYICLFLISVPYLIKIKKLNFMILLAPIFFLLIYYLFNQLPFLSAKINMYFQNMGTNTYVVDIDRIKVNRFEIFIQNIEQTIYWPFGYGILTSKYIIEKYGVNRIGVNGLGSILQIWGVYGMYMFVNYLTKFLKYLGKQPAVIHVFCIIAILLAIFSNPVHKNTLVLMLFYTPLIFTKEQIINSFNNEK